MKRLIGFALIAIGLYVGGCWAFIGGIIDVITQIRADELSVHATAWGVTKIIFASVFAGIFIIPGLFIGGRLENNKRSR